jgi:hypothetical protein
MGFGFMESNLVEKIFIPKIYEGQLPLLLEVRAMAHVSTLQHSMVNRTKKEPPLHI